MAGNPNEKVKAKLGANAEGKLRGKAKELIKDKNVMTFGDIWRFSGFEKVGLPNPAEDPVLKDVTMDDLRSIADAFVQKLKDDGYDGWSYKSTYSCCCCTG